jgi:Ca2+/Na+ antiporter
MRLLAFSIISTTFFIGATWLATLFFARGRVGRAEGLLLVGLYSAYIVLHVALR